MRGRQTARPPRPARPGADGRARPVGPTSGRWWPRTSQATTPGARRHQRPPTGPRTAPPPGDVRWPRLWGQVEVDGSRHRRASSPCRHLSLMNPDEDAPAADATPAQRTAQATRPRAAPPALENPHESVPMPGHPPRDAGRSSRPDRHAPSTAPPSRSIQVNRKGKAERKGDGGAARAVGGWGLPEAAGRRTPARRGRRPPPT